MAWLLDTNILAELRRPQPEAKVVEFVARQPLDQLFVSAVTLAEIRFGIELVSGPRRELLNNWLTSTIRPTSWTHVLPARPDDCRNSRTIPGFDLLCFLGVQIASDADWPHHRELVRKEAGYILAARRHLSNLVHRRPRLSNFPHK